MSSDLNESMQRLRDKLGPNYEIYVQLLGRWFRGSISKEEFDKSAKQLTTENFVIEHNKFWLAFFHHCANNTTNSLQSHKLPCNNDGKYSNGSDITSQNRLKPEPSDDIKIRCLPSKVITHMKTFVIAWEMGLESTNDNVSLFINLALQHFLKNIITELICTKTAYRLRENRFKHAIGVKSINPYLTNSLNLFGSLLEYDPYQIESNKMNSSLVDTHAYNDSLFPSRLYEAQALYEYACTTTTSVRSINRTKRIKISEAPPTQPDEKAIRARNSAASLKDHDYETPYLDSNSQEKLEEQNIDTNDSIPEQTTDLDCPPRDEHSLTMSHLLMAFLNNRTIIPSQRLYSINLERIFTKLSH